MIERHLFRIIADTRQFCVRLRPSQKQEHRLQRCLVAEISGTKVAEYSNSFFWHGSHLPLLEESRECGSGSGIGRGEHKEGLRSLAAACGGDLTFGQKARTAGRAAQ